MRWDDLIAILMVEYIVILDLHLDELCHVTLHQILKLLTSQICVNIGCDVMCGLFCYVSIVLLLLMLV